MRSIYVFLLLLPIVSSAQKVALTFDDLPLNGTLPRGVTEVDIVKQTLPILAARKAPPVFGFINAKKLEANENGAKALQLWVAGGQRVGNHTYSHIDLSSNSPEAFATDTQQNEPALMLLSPENDWRWFRYPYLREGDTLEKRHAVRALLKERNYAIAQTTLDYEDYMWNSAYARCVDRNDAKSIEWLRKSYLEITAAYLDANRTMAKLVYGRDINHVLLLHLGAFTPEILPPLLDLLEKKGFTLVTLEEAQRDPAYQADPDLASERGGSLVEQHMDARKLQYPKLPPKPRKELDTICK